MSYTLLQNQLGIFGAEQVSGDGSNYNIETLTKLPSVVNLDRLRHALDAAVAAHPYIKSHLIRTPKQDILLEAQDIPFETQVLDVDDIASVRGDLDRPYDFFHGFLFRLEIYRTPKGNFLYTNFSHLISDGWSHQVFFREVSRAYNNEPLLGEEGDLFALHRQEEEVRCSDVYEEEKAWFQKEFSSFDETDSLPLPDSQDQEPFFDTYTRPLSVDDATLENFIKQTKTSKATVFTAAFALTLSKFSADDKVFFSTIYHGRTDASLYSSLGMLVRTLPVAVDLQGIDATEELLRTLRTQSLKTRNSRAYAFTDLGRDLGVKSDILFTYQDNFHHFELTTDGITTSIAPYEDRVPGLFFCTQIFRGETGYALSCIYPAHRYSNTLMENFFEVYQTILDELLIKPQLQNINVSSHRQIGILDGLNTPAFSSALGRQDIVSLFAESVRNYPDMTALVFKDHRYSFRQLDEMTDRLGAVIYDQVKGSDSQPVVSILISRNENMVIAPLAAMKAGCAYQPLDPAYPRQRLNFMVKDASAALVIEEPVYADMLDEYTGKRLSTDSFDDIFHDESLSGASLPGVSPEDAMVLLYTSGSTGVPKGVILEHRNVTTWCSWYNDYLDLAPGDNLASYASFGFDAHMADICPALTGARTLHIIPEEIRLDLIALNQYFIDNQVRCTTITTAVAYQFATNIRKSSLKYLLTGGEKLASLDPPTDYTLINLYGPTEATMCVTEKRVLQKESNIPIGKCYSINKLYIVDRFMHRLPVGAPGELIIAGPQVGRGYLNRPDKTAEVFISNPFSQEENALFQRAYRTGDIVRYRENGDIEFVGRRDHQVKIHGYRIELKEVEAVIREFDGITDATVQAFDDPNGGKFIAAYVCGTDPVDIPALHAFIAEKKPSYMVPLVTMQIDKIPYNVNQKVDKNALPKPEAAPAVASQKVAVPMNVLEEQIHALLSELLGTDAFGVADALTAVGLTSINSIKLSAMLYQAYGISLNAFDLLDGATLQTIENEILKQWMTSSGGETAESSIASSEENTTENEHQETNPPLQSPLGFAQQGVYSECLTNPESTFYNISLSLRLPDATKAGDVQRAVGQLIKAHPALRSHFTSDDAQSIIQAELPDFTASVPILTMSAEEFAEYKRTFVKPFDLEGGPLSRFEIVNADALYLLIDLHHLIADGASVDILLQELCCLLDGKAISPETFTCFDLAAGQRITEENEAFFDQVMGDVEEASQLIPDVYEKDLPHTEGTICVPADLAAIIHYAQEHALSPAAVYLSAAFLTVSRYICEDQVAIATISSGRSDVRLAHTVGMFVNTLPLASRLSPEESTGDFIRRTAELFTGVIRHENHPFAAIAARYDFKPQISYAYQVGVLSCYETQQGTLQTENLESDRAKLPISIQIFGDETTGGSIQINYDTALFSEDFARRFARSIRLAAMQLILPQTLADISLTNEEDWKILDGYNQPMRLDFDPEDSVVSKFKKIVSAFPDKDAAIYKDKIYTYRELDETTDRLAACIYERICKITGKTDLAEQVVSVIISRSEQVFLLPLAILKAGCGYEPLDPSYPKERLNFMVQDSGASLLIAQRDLAELVDDYHGEVLYVDELMSAAAALDHYTLPAAPKAHDLMIMLYTSGSTGTPKGCQIEHGNMVAFAYGSNYEGFYTTDGRTASFASFGFDVCMSDTFCTLLNGATLCVIPEEVRMNLGELASYFNNMGITQVLLTTQVGVQFVQNYPKMDTLRFLVMGGEKLPAMDPSQLSYTIINGYGPTENCCGVSLFPIRFYEPNVPIGKPMVTIAGYVLDKSGHRLPAGAAGEYCLCGPQVTRGYLNRPDKTAEAYTQSPFNRFRMYHTGDIVRYRENGDVEFVGRKDGQVKIRGFRVETKEVEAVIREYPGIKDATVQAYSYDNGGKYLAAFIVSEDAVDISRLNQFIKDRKPAYMVPLVTMQIDKIPLTINQKVDKKALPKPEVKKAGYEAPKGQAEEDFCTIFSQILGVEKVGTADDFFELGGSSISAMRVVVAANQLGYAIVYQNVFENTTPKMLAAFTGNNAVAAPCENSPEPQIEDAASFYGEGVTEIGRDGYDYHAINALLRGNTVEAFRSGEQQKLGDVLLCGSTGYLGTHVFRQLVLHTDSRIYCQVRSKKGQDAQQRFQELLRYYFGEDYAPLFGTRIFLLEGDAIDPSTFENFRMEAQNITVINCAASVKHFAKGDEIERANLGIVRNLIDWCQKNGARLVHISTESIFGHPANAVPRDGLIYDEHLLYAGQVYEDNQYVRSKFLAERLIYEKILSDGLNAKVLRAGNLAPRSSDGHFQVNYATNNYMNTLKGFSVLGLVPYAAATTPTEFSPIDKVAEAVVLLSGTPRACVCFMMSNNHRPLMGDVVEGLQSYGYSIRYAEDEEFGEALQEALRDPARCDAMQPFMAYTLNNADTKSSLGLEDLGVSYTAQILARLGFTWPVCCADYYQRFLEAMGGLHD